MAVFIVTREENGRFAMWPPFVKQDKATAMINSHLFFRFKNGASLHRTISIEPPINPPGSKVRCGGNDGNPIMTDAPDVVNCVIHEVEIVNETGSRCIYRVTQSHVQE